MLTLRMSLCACAREHMCLRERVCAHVRGRGCMCPRSCLHEGPVSSANSDRGIIQCVHGVSTAINVDFAFFT